MAQQVRSGSAGRSAASWLQEQWWFVDQWHTGAAAPVATLVLRLAGPCDPVLVRQVVRELTARHEALRTTFEPDGERVVQVVAAGSVEVLTVESRPPGPKPDLVAEEAARRFELRTGPNFRARLVSVGDEDHLLCFTGHRAVVDAASLELLAREFVLLSAGRVLGPARGYAEVAPDRSPGPGLAAHWRAKLDGLGPAELPLDFPRPPTMSFRGGTVTAVLPAARSDRLRALAGRLHVGLPAALTAATAVVLGRHGGAEPFVLGAGHPGRAAPGAESVAGPFADTLALRVELAGHQTVAGLLVALQQELDDAVAHSVPSPSLAGLLDRPRDASRHPVFQIGVEVVGEPGAGIGEPGPWRQDPVVPAPDQRLDLRVLGRLSPDGFSLTLEYALDLFDRRRIEHLAAQLVHVLGELAAEPTARLADLDPLPAAERDRLDHGWQGADRSFPDTPVHELFARQARLTPAAVAVGEPGRELTYAELDAAANRVANFLRRRGVGPDVAAAVCVERGADALVAILGVLKAGGAYVPLDPAYPAQRLNYVLDDSRARVLVTHGPLLALFDGLGPAQPVLLDADAAGIAAESPVAPETGVTPENLAYLMYTSGSTGRPKGVCTRHRNLSWYLSWFTELIPAAEFRRVFGTIGFAFDVSAMDLWPPILTGGCVRLTDGLLAVPDTSPELEGTTLMNLVPSVLAEYLRGNRLPSTVRTITVGGEALSEALLREIFARSEVTDVFHLYGPTETTVFVTAKHFTRGREEPVTLGSPASRTRVDVLDAHGRVTPAGVPGELCVSGPCVAGGYLGRPRLTAERFVPNPHRADRAVMYRTGDLGRWNFDGELEFLGRLDDQIKVRGVRIEPGEIEAVLGRHPDVAQAVVAAKDHVLGHQELVAYVVPRQPGLEAERLRPFCQEALPAVMVPAAFAVISEIPRSPIGKTDRRALPVPPELREQPGRAGAAPGTPAERLLAEIWSEVLGKPVDRADEHFFRSGGHSLSAIRLAAEIERRAGVRIPVRTLFKTPVLAELATLVEQAAPQLAQSRGA